MGDCQSVIHIFAILCRAIFENFRALILRKLLAHMPLSAAFYRLYLASVSRVCLCVRVCVCARACVRGC